MKKIGSLFILLALCFVMPGCSSGMTPIGEITAEPSSYVNRDVKVIGEVSERLAIGEEGVLTISDATGSIQVYTKGEMPEQGKKVVVSGRVQPMLKLGPYDFGTIIEAEKIRGSHFWESSPSEGETEEEAGD